MRKIYLLFAGALLATLPALSQPTRTPYDAKIIFHQNFEATEGLTDEESYIEWSRTPIDTIRELEYYSRIGTSSLSSGTDIYDGSTDWEIFAVRTDSASSEWTDVKPGDGIVMFNGVETTSSASEKANKVYQFDEYKIKNDKGIDANRIAAFEAYGEDGGKSFFQYTTGDISKARTAGEISSSHYSSDTRSTKKYRRDLYVRGLDIEDESSYRLTFFIKTKKLNSWEPLFYADVMRGYHHQRAAFSMGYKSGKEFILENPSFTDGQWQKITLMTYYLNAHEADGYVIYKGDYSWSDDWTWHPSQDLWPAGKTLNDGDNLNYIKQPDKFFLRFSFATDSIEYSLDNIALTKSWIAGCEYYKDKLRVDFGYDTNLKDLAKAAKAKTNIAAVEIPDEDGKYFEVWCLKKGCDPDDPNSWEDMPIRSAEYHDDGYMYMFTDFYTVGGEEYPFEFEDYDQVLVTFHNPQDNPEMTLKYTGSLYPKALDTEWVEAGKIVPDFYNEIATPNPYVFNGIHSMSVLPPVLQEIPYEDGSFGLDPVDQFEFKFSRKVLLDDAGEASTKVIAYVGNNVWIPSYKDGDEKTLVITKPNNLPALKGDVEIHIIQIMGVGPTEEGEEVLLHYHFGEFSKTVSATQINSDWRSEAPTVLEGYNPASTYVYDAASSFRKGSNSSSKKAKSRVHAMGASYPDNCGYQLTTQSSSTGEGKTANVYTIVHFDKAEDCIIQFKATGWSYSSNKLPGIPGYLYFYPKPDGELADGNENGFAILEACQKTEIGTFTPTTFVNKGDIEDKDTGEWPSDVETFKFNFTVPEAGDYVFEWVAKNGNKDGYLMSNYSISSANAGDLSTMYVKSINDIYDKAVEKKAEVDNATRDYKGDLYNSFASLIATFKENAFKETAPSAYNNNVTIMSNAISEMQARMDTVDLYYATEANAKAKLDGINGDSVNLTSYKALDQHIKANAGLVCSTKQTSELTAQINAYESEMQAIDDRLALMDKFADAIKETKALIDDKDARNNYEEYALMVRAYNSSVTYDVITPDDDAMNAQFNLLAGAKKAYVFRYDAYVAKTRQIKELFALADTLGYDFAGLEGGKDGVKAAIDALDDEDAQLSTVLRQAAILQINRIYAANNPSQLQKLAGLNVSALIPNYYLRNDVQIDRDLKQRSNGTWYINRKANTDIIPGWTLTPNSSSGYWYFTTAKVDDPYETAAYTDWEADGHIFIGGLRSATSTKGVINTDVVGLPQGYYGVGLYCYNNTSDLYYEFKSEADTVYTDKVINLNGGKNTVFKEIVLDSVYVNGTLYYKIDQKSSSSGEFDMRSAVLRLTAPDSEFSYDGVVTTQEAELTQLITIVDAPVQKAGVQYYNLGGMQVDAPKSGEILIRKTVQGGKVVVDKVLIK
ncbi:MAG: hypothetical protein J6W42_03895 [Bacteroidaceae bacterium]|nr:hypothetical protein [Bacteroidaceae bacterium]